jgi:hypothetical protein
MFHVIQRVAVNAVGAPVTIAFVATSDSSSLVHTYELSRPSRDTCARSVT